MVVYEDGVATIEQVDDSHYAVRCATGVVKSTKRVVPITANILTGRCDGRADFLLFKHDENRTFMLLVDKRDAAVKAISQLFTGYCVG